MDLPPWMGGATERGMSVGAIIHTVVSQPGPAEEKLLASAPFFSMHRRVAAGCSLRTLETAADRAPRILFVHGRGHAASLWIPVARELEPDFGMVAVDVPGFAHSAFRAPQGSTQRDALAAFAEPIAALTAELAPDVLVGHSLGGLLALHAALEVPSVKALVLVGSMGLSTHANRRARAYLSFGPERLARTRRWLPVPTLSGTSGDPLVVSVRRELLLSQDADRAKPWFDRLLPFSGPACSLEDRLADLRCKTLLLWGDRDEAFPVPLAMQARARMKDAKLVVLPTGHSPHLEQPARVAAEIRQFATDSIGAQT